MNRPRIRIHAAFLLFILLPAVAGVLAVHASATCERFVRTIVSKPVRNRVSQQTAEAWATWRIAHPEWKPPPALHRPRFRLTRSEAVQKVEFACAVDTIPSDLALGFVPPPVEPPPPLVLLPPPASTQIDFPSLIPPQVAEDVPAPVLAILPVIPLPVIYGNVTPEPAAWSLTLLGMLGLGVLLRGKRVRGASAD